MLVSDLQNNFENTLTKMRRAGISVYAADVADLAELVDLLGPRFRYDFVRATTVGAVRRAGFDLEQTMDWPHHTILLPDAAVETFERLRGCFEPAVDLREIRRARRDSIS